LVINKITAWNKGTRTSKKGLEDEKYTTLLKPKDAWDRRSQRRRCLQHIQDVRSVGRKGSLINGYFREALFIVAA
jgi:hypothetical protein